MDAAINGSQSRQTLCGAGARSDVEGCWIGCALSKLPGAGCLYCSAGWSECLEVQETVELIRPRAIADF